MWDNSKEKDFEKIYLVLEELNEFFHNESHYENKADIKKFAKHIYPKIRSAYYDISWNLLSEETQKKIREE